jgi:hypothetical protein
VDRRTRLDDLDGTLNPKQGTAGARSSWRAVAGMARGEAPAHAPSARAGRLPPSLSSADLGWAARVQLAYTQRRSDDD